MGSSARLFTAMTLVVMPVSTGLFASPSFAAEAVEAKGGCWGYTVADTGSAATAEELLRASREAAAEPGAPRIRDGVVGADSVAPAQIAWTPSPDGARLTLTSQGSTATSGKRGFEVTLSQGPALSADAVKGTAHAVLQVSVAGATVPDLVFASAEFEQAAGGHVGPLTFTTADGFDLTSEGAHRVELSSLYFIAPILDSAGAPVASAAPQMWACNGQTETAPTALSTTTATGVVAGANPASTPVALDGVAVEFQVADATTLTLSKVVGQTVTQVVRPGDEVVIAAAGLMTSAEYRVGFGPAAGPFVLADATVASDEYGNVAPDTTAVVPVDAPVGEGVLTLVDASGASVGSQLKLTVLGSPTLAVVESAGEGALDLAVAGAGFDPGAEVRMRSRVGDAAGSDAVVRATVGADGTFETTYAVVDQDADTLRALQRRVDGRAELRASHELTEAVPAAPATADPSPRPTTGVSPVAPSSGGVAAPVSPPVQIPIPVPTPVSNVGDPVVPTPQGGADLKVSKARLDGSPSMGERFGGASRRDVKFEVENTGDEVSTGTEVMLGVGRTPDALPTLVAAELGDLDPGARVGVRINVSLPMASFGTYQVVGQVGMSPGSAFTIRWDTYPWGLISVNALGLGLLAWGVNRRRTTAVPIVPGAAGEEAGASVVDLSALDKWWKEGKVVKAVSELPDENDSVVDLAAADRWWSRNQNNVS